MAIKEKTILIVDDVRLNRKMIKGYLSSLGCGFTEAADGQEALEKALSQPELILMDIMMPSMDGIEACRILKENESTKDIPVIFLSAVEDSKTKIEGFEMGGVDYVNKPVEPKELLARVKTHLTLREQQVRITEYSKKLEQMVEERTCQLVHADRLATLGTFSAAVAHEINSPLTYIMANVDLLKYSWSEAGYILAKQPDNADIGRMKKTVAGLDEKLELILKGAEKISRLVQNFQVYARQAETPKMECRLIEIINESLNLIQHRIKKGVRTKVEVSRKLKLYGDPQKLSQVFVNLFNNAVDASTDRMVTICVKASLWNNRVKILVEDDGPGIAPEKSAMIFEPFYTSKAKGEGTGLGLFIVRSIIEEHQGEIVLERTGDQGAAFRIELPVHRLGP